MPDQEDGADALQSSRRSFFGTAIGAMSFSVAASCGAVGAADAPQPTSGADDQVPPLTKAARDALTPDEIIARAKAGNERFRTGRKRHRDLLVELQKTAGGQSPAAVVLGCIDSRAPAEIIFDLGLGDIFNCRVAGNVESADMLGSMEFATKLSGAKLVVVLGHSSCGAVKGAVAEAELGNLTQLLAKIRPAVAQTTYSGKRTADNPEFVDAVARRSVQLTIGRIRTGSPVIAELEKSGAIKIVGCFFDLSTGGIEFLS
jgi:carbonic anhydrase